MLTMSRNPEVESAAEHLRQIRRLYAQRLREARHAVQTGNPKARDRLKRLSASPCPVPNPDRREDCARAADRALERYNDLKATAYGAATDAAAKYAELLTILQITARY